MHKTIKWNMISLTQKKYLDFKQYFFALNLSPIVLKVSKLYIHTMQGAWPCDISKSDRYQKVIHDAYHWYEVICYYGGEVGGGSEI